MPSWLNKKDQGLNVGRWHLKLNPLTFILSQNSIYIYIFFCLFWLWSSLVFVAWKRAAQTFCWISSLVFFGAEKVIWVSKWCEASLLGKKKKGLSSFFFIFSVFIAAGLWWYCDLCVATVFPLPVIWFLVCLLAFNAMN